MQSVTATTYIGENKGDDTYAPARMIDGLEETCFQFRTSVTKLGKEYGEFYISEIIFNADMSSFLLRDETGFALMYDISD